MLYLGQRVRCIGNHLGDFDGGRVIGLEGVITAYSDDPDRPLDVVFDNAPGVWQCATSELRPVTNPFAALEQKQKELSHA
jgi:hypothetical protein